MLHVSSLNQGNRHDCYALCSTTVSSKEPFTAKLACMAVDVF